MPELPRRARDLAAGVLGALCLAAAAAAQPAPAPPEAPHLAEDTLAAAGRQETLLSIPRFGRYSIEVSSERGTSLQVIDRMAGPGEVAGAAGSQDGRVDLFLDRGEVQVRTLGDERADGEVHLAVHPFTEIATGPPRELVEGKPIEAELGDLEQRSTWLRIAERRRVVLEAAGRDLADLRLWQDGAWLVDAEPAKRVISPRSGRPLLLCQLTADLAPGLYRLTAYGGPEQAWATDDPAHPFCLRYGIPEAPLAARRRLVVSPFGFDRFLVPAAASFFRLELPEARPARLAVGLFDAERPFAPPEATAAIVKQSVPPVAEIRRASQDDGLVAVVIQAEAGQPYVLQHFRVRDRYSFERQGSYWISTVHSGHPADSIDATGVLFDREARSSHLLPMAVQAIEIAPDHGWARRVNLLEPATVFLRVPTAGSYTVRARGIAARIRIEPLALGRPQGYRPPPFREGDSTWELDPGLYVLTAEPVEAGILDLAIAPRGLLDRRLENAGVDRRPESQPVLGSVRFVPVELKWGHDYTLLLNHQPGVVAGIVLRPLPLDPTVPLPLTQRPGEVVEVPLTVPSPGTLRAEAEDGSLLEVSVDGGPAETELHLAPGRHRAEVRWNGEVTVSYSLALVPDELAPDAPLPELPAGSLDNLPSFPLLTDASPQFFDLAAKEAKTFLLRADRPALYQVESSGLLATEGNLRTRVVPSLSRRAENGTGRNFLVQPYLREGDYQVTVTARGRSAGHLGLSLRRTPIVDGGLLRDGIAARGELPAGEAVAYRFRVAEKGKYRLRTIGVGRTFEVRIEDDDGWPVTAPRVSADLELELLPGAYRVIVLPQTVSARQVTLFERVREAPRFAGHGPHPLPLATVVEHLWTEPAAGGERTPDAWRFHLPAPATAQVALDGEMEGELFRLAPEGRRKVASVPPGRGFKGPLASGDYELDARAARVDNRVEYHVSVRLEELVAGESRRLRVPAEVPVSVGGEALVELSSYGATDVRARLYDQGGHLVAADDDRPGDWNFLLARRLAPGRYRLRVDPVGAEAGGTTVSMRLLDERSEAPLRPPGERRAELGDDVHLLPLDLPAKADQLIVEARSGETVGVSIEAHGPDGFRALATRVGREVRLEMPLAAGGGPYRLRLWSPDRRGNAVDLAVTAGRAARVSEAALARGVRVRPADGHGAFVAVDLERPGCFGFPAGSGLRFASRPGDAATAVDGAVPAFAGTLWLAADTPGGRPARLSGRRLYLDPVRSTPLRLRIPAGERATCDVAPASGPVLARATATAMPGVDVRDRAREPGPARLDRRFAPAPRAALTAALSGGEPEVTAWASGTEAADVDLTAWAFPDRPDETATWGSLEGALDGLAQRAFDLPAGAKLVRLVLPPAVAAVVATGVETEAVVWSEGGNRAEELWTSADRLALFHLEAGSAPFRVEIFPAPAAAPGPTPGHPFERWLAHRSTLRLALPDGAGTVHVRGAALALLAGADGSLAAGRDLPVPPGGGTLHLTPPASGSPELLLAWLGGGAAAPPWPEAAAPPTAPLALPAVVPLDGVEKAVALELPAESLLALRSATPLAVGLTSADGSSRLEVYAHGATFDALLPAGTAELRLRGLAGAELAGSAELTAAPVVPIGEGLGPEVLLAGGETRAFAFQVTTGGAVGVGVRAEADLVRATLLDATGRPLGRGVVQMHELDPGRYVLTVSLPRGAPPVAVRPAVAGLEPPGHGPPEEVVRHYLELARGAAAGRGNHTGEDGDQGGEP